MPRESVEMETLQRTVPGKFGPVVTVISDEFNTDIKATSEFERDHIRPVVLKVPEGTKLVHVTFKGVEMWFGDATLEERPLARFSYEFREGTLVGREFKFVIQAFLGNQGSTLAWGAGFKIGVLCFG
jgi:hypothetical protein